MTLGFYLLHWNFTRVTERHFWRWNLTCDIEIILVTMKFHMWHIAHFWHWIFIGDTSHLWHWNLLVTQNFFSGTEISLVTHKFHLYKVISLVQCKIHIAKTVFLSAECCRMLPMFFLYDLKNLRNKLAEDLSWWEGIYRLTYVTICVGRPSFLETAACWVFLERTTRTLRSAGFTSSLMLPIGICKKTRAAGWK